MFCPYCSLLKMCIWDDNLRVLASVHTCHAQRVETGYSSKQWSGAAMTRMQTECIRKGRRISLHRRARQLDVLRMGHLASCPGPGRCPRSPPSRAKADPRQGRQGGTVDKRLLSVARRRSLAKSCEALPPGHHTCPSQEDGIWGGVRSVSLNSVLANQTKDIFA